MRLPLVDIAPYGISTVLKINQVFYSAQRTPNKSGWFEPRHTRPEFIAHYTARGATHFCVQIRYNAGDVTDPLMVIANPDVSASELMKLIELSEETTAIPGVKL